MVCSTLYGEILATAVYTDGSGLGPFIVKEVIKGNKEKVWVESEEGKGSTVNNLCLLFLDPTERRQIEFVK